MLCLSTRHDKVISWLRSGVVKVVNVHFVLLLGGWVEEASTLVLSWVVSSVACAWSLHPVLWECAVLVVLWWDDVALWVCDVCSFVAVDSLLWAVVAAMSTEAVLLLLVIWTHWSVAAYSLRPVAKTIQHRLLWRSSWSHGDFIFAAVWSCGFAHYIWLWTCVESTSLLLCSCFHTWVSMSCPSDIILLCLRAIVVWIVRPLPPYLLRLVSRLNRPLCITVIQTVVEDARALSMCLRFAADLYWPSPIHQYLMICRWILLRHNIIITAVQINHLPPFALRLILAKLHLLTVILSHLIITYFTYCLRHRWSTIHSVLIDIVLVHIGRAIREVEATVLFLWLLSYDLCLVEIASDYLPSASWAFFSLGHFFLDLVCYLWLLLWPKWLAAMPWLPLRMLLLCCILVL